MDKQKLFMPHNPKVAFGNIGFGIFGFYSVGLAVMAFVLYLSAV